MIKKFGKTFLILLFLNELSPSQAFKLSGYLSEFAIYQNVKEEFAQTFGIGKNLLVNISRLRLRPEFDLAKIGKIYIEYEVNGFYHSSELFFNPVELTSRRQFYKMRWALHDGKKLEIYHFIDRFYIRKDFNFGNLIIGRQRISWGTGRVWNPTDLFNPINPADFSKIEKDGADAVTWKIYLGSFTDLHVVYNPVNRFKSNNFGFRFRSNAKGFDFSFMSGYFDKRGIVGFDFAGNFLNAGIRGEGIISADVKNLRSNFLKFILGFDNQFTKNFYALFEYQFNGEGKTKKEEYEIERLTRGEILNLSKSYAFISAVYTINPILSLTFSLNQNLNDWSGFVNALLSYSPTENSEVGFGIIMFFGDKLDEYWYYSTSAFLKFQFFL